MEILFYISLFVIGGVFGWFYGVSQATKVFLENPGLIKDFGKDEPVSTITDLTLTAEQHGSQWYLYQENQFVSQGISIEHALAQAIDRWDNDTHITIIKSDKFK